MLASVDIVFSVALIAAGDRAINVVYRGDT